MNKMTRDEMRFLRRDWIQYYLRQCKGEKLCVIKSYVRWAEKWEFGQELKVYSVSKIGM